MFSMLVVYCCMYDIWVCLFVSETSEEWVYGCADYGCMCSFCCGDIFKMLMMLSVGVANTIVVDHFLIL